MNPTVFASIVAAAIVVCVLAILALVYLLLRVRLESLLQRRLDPQAHAVARDFGVAGTAPMIETMARSGKAIEQMIDTEGESGRLMIQAGWRSAKARLFWYAFQAAMPVVLFAGILLFWTFSESPARTLVDRKSTRLNSSH